MSDAEKKPLILRNDGSPTAGSDPYEVLGVPADASPQKLRSAFRMLSARYHPDRVRANPQTFPDETARDKACELFKRVQEAYAEISSASQPAEEEYFNPAYAEYASYPTVRFYPAQTLDKSMKRVIEAGGDGWVCEDFESLITSGHRSLCIGIDLPIRDNQGAVDEEAMRRWQRFTESSIGAGYYLAADALMDSYREYFVADAAVVHTLLKHHVITPETARTLLEYAMPDLSRAAESTDYRERIAAQTRLRPEDVQALETKGLLLPRDAEELRAQIGQSNQRA